MTDFWHRLDNLIDANKIVIDRPHGTTHPRYPDVVYPLDYGYVTGTAAGTGAPAAADATPRRPHVRQRTEHGSARGAQRDSDARGAAATPSGHFGAEHGPGAERSSTSSINS